MTMRYQSLRAQSGFTLLEVMITGLILAAALLSISGLQTTASNVEYEAYQRARAIVLADDMIARINANRTNVASYVTGTSNYWGTGDAQPATCTGTGHTLDACEWSNLLKGSSVTAGGAAQPAMNRAIGCIVASSTAQEYFVVIAWLGQTASTATKPSSCGSTVYNNESYRRVLVRGMRIANLNNLTIPTPPVVLP